jgi:hypothetical protein
VLVAVFLVGWPIWRSLAPRPMRVLRVLAGIAGSTALCVTLGCMTRRVPAGAYEIALHAYGLVALALYAEIALALLDRRNHRSELVPRMRALRAGGRRRAQRDGVERVLLAP